MTEIFKDSAGEWRFRVKGANGEIVATSEGYSTKSNARRGLKTLITILIKPKVAVPRKLRIWRR